MAQPQRWHRRHRWLRRGAVAGWVRRFGWPGWVGLAGLCAGLGLLAGAFAYPEKMPDRVGEAIGNLTGANPHPVKLVVPRAAPLGVVAQLGRDLFYDASLSASGRQSCASCHSAARAYGPPNDLSVQPGGPHLERSGVRAPPSLAYLYRQPAFRIGPDAGDNDAAPVSLGALASAAQGVPRANKVASQSPAAPAMVPQGGLFWDGRANTLERQAIMPLTDPNEMANDSVQTVADKIIHSPHAKTFARLFGARVLKDPVLLASEAMFAIGRYQVEDPSFHAFTSKYDAWLQGKARLTSAELRGLRLFNDPHKANCAGCHLSQPTPDGMPPLFTDTQYEALAVPRNRTLPVNRDPHFYDLGICGPLRKDLAAQTQYCGMFLTPTLRNSASRHVYFHNGAYHDLRQVLDFYNLREIYPERIYPRDAAGHVLKYDDIPAQYQANVDHADAPFDRKAGDALPMSEQDMNDIIAFLKTLDDGYRPDRTH